MYLFFIAFVGNSPKVKMIPQIKDILRTLEHLAPATLAEKWDNVGLLVGSPQNDVCTILIGLDPTNTLLDEALSVGADTIITHHPVIFHPISAIRTDTPAGRILQKALTNNINIIACHTNFDSAADGVNDILAEALGLTQLSPLQPNPEAKHQGMGRIGILPNPLSCAEFFKRLLSVLKLQSVDVAGPLPAEIAKVALCGGSGSDLASIAFDSGADIYLSAEIKHSTAIWAHEVGFAIIDGSHYATEKPATIALAERLTAFARQHGWQTTIRLTETERHPFASINTNSALKTKTQLTGEQP